MSATSSMAATRFWTDRRIDRRTVWDTLLLCNLLDGDRRRMRRSAWFLCGPLLDTTDSEQTYSLNTVDGGGGKAWMSSTQYRIKAGVPGGRAFRARPRENRRGPWARLRAERRQRTARAVRPVGEGYGGGLVRMSLRGRYSPRTGLWVSRRSRCMILRA